MRRPRSGPDLRNLVPLVDRIVEQRFGDAAQAVSALRAADPDATTGQLADALIRRAARELAVGGALAGGAAAAPVAGMGVAAATAGMDASVSVGRLSELVMALGIVYGHGHASAAERAGWIWAVLGLSEGAAVGLTGLAARVGARGGARLLSRLPEASRASVNAKLSKRVVSRMAGGRGPWSLAALVPYGIGAGVGAAGNAVLAHSVGRAAKQFFATSPPPPQQPLFEDAGDGELIDDPIEAEVVEEHYTYAEVIDVEVIDTQVIDAEVTDAEVIDAAVVVDAEIVEDAHPADP